MRPVSVPQYKKGIVRSWSNAGCCRVLNSPSRYSPNSHQLLMKAKKRFTGPVYMIPARRDGTVAEISPVV